MLSQLHSVFSTHTLIERELSTLIASGIICKLVLRGSSSDGRGGEVTGTGGEIGLILSSAFTSLIPSDLPSFSSWIQGPGRTVVSVSHSNLVSSVTEEEIKRAMEAG